jgi:hypothetical protein
VSHFRFPFLPLDKTLNYPPMPLLSKKTIRHPLAWSQSTHRTTGLAPPVMELRIARDGAMRQWPENRAPPAMEQRALSPQSPSRRRRPCYPTAGDPGRYLHILPPRSKGAPHPRSSPPARKRALWSRLPGRELDDARPRAPRLGCEIDGAARQGVGFGQVAD